MAEPEKKLAFLDQDAILECPKCGTVWLEKFRSPMSLSAFVRRMRSWSCIKCDNAKKILMLTGERYFKEKDRMRQEGKL